MGAAELVLAVNAISKEHADQNIMGTVGVLNVQLGSINTIPGLVELGVDIRGTEEELIDHVVDQVISTAQQIGDDRNLAVEVTISQRAHPIQLPVKRVTALERACRAMEVPYTRMISRTAHDAMYLGQHGPVGMLFIRNANGISHSPAEEARDEDVILGTSVLATYLAWVAQAGN